MSIIESYISRENDKENNENPGPKCEDLNTKRSPVQTGPDMVCTGLLFIFVMLCFRYAAASAASASSLSSSAQRKVPVFTTSSP